MEYLELPYPVINVGEQEIKLPKALEFIRAISASKYSKLIECFVTIAGDEVVVFDTQPEVGSNPKNDIRYVERIAVHFFSTDQWLPSVYALREDFPLVSHLNMMAVEKPRNLCLYEVGYEELKFSWRGVSFLERIREWLSSTAADKLHQGSQPLEPFFLNLQGHVVFNQPLTPNQKLYIYRVSPNNCRVSLIAHIDPIPALESHSFKAVAFTFFLQPQVHGVIRSAPLTLYDLDVELARSGFSLIEKNLKPALSDYYNQSHLHSYKIALIIVIPKRRNENGEVESNDIFTFITSASIRDIAVAVNLWGVAAGMLGHIIPAVAHDKKASEITITPFGTLVPFNKDTARILSSVTIDEGEIRIVQIGVGSLGSHLNLNLNRMGFGRWTTIDDDFLYPHNLAKHALTRERQGFSKSESMMITTNRLLSDARNTAIHDNFLNPKEATTISDSLHQADYILDTSASLPVARKLALDFELAARKVSMFFNPMGNDLVLLGEGTDSKVSLDVLEMQYYRLVINTPELANHLSLSPDNVRYSNSCRDVTSKISQENISTLSGIASKALKSFIPWKSNAIKIWQLAADGSVKLFENKISNSLIYRKNDWTIKTDAYVVDKIRRHRLNRLPNETGGILIGSYDLTRKVIYIVDTILSPDDSKEYPNAYYRGIEGVTNELARIENATSGNVYYVGEWHSHPDGYSLEMSNDDKKLFMWINAFMSSIGFPALMLISGDNAEQIYVT